MKLNPKNDEVVAIHFNSFQFISIHFMSHFFSLFMKSWFIKRKQLKSCQAER